MKKILLVFALTLLASASVAAQNPSASYRFDNFDVPGGVRIVTPPAPAARAPRGKLKLTARTSANSQASAQTPAQSSRALRSSEVSPAISTAPTLSMADASALDGFSTGDASIDRFIVDSGTRNGVDPVLLYAIMHRESSFKRNALSPKGARGLMQLMPGTAARFGVRNPHDPAQNVSGGARYLKELLGRFRGRVDLVLASYNAGEGNVMRFGYRVPPFRETRNYVRRVGARYTKGE